MKVLHVARECAPLAKAGGLADVVGALPAAAARVPGGVEGAILLPAYDALLSLRGEPVLEGAVRAGGTTLRYRVSLAHSHAAGVPCFLVEQATFAGPAPYGGDELEREAVLSAAALDLGARFDVVHVHDHHAALACIGLAGHPPPRPIVVTVHNARYHGALSWQQAESLDLPATIHRGRCDHGGAFNRLKASILHAGVVSTVSPTHAADLVSEPESSAGLDYAFRSLGDRLVGILNGIDERTWDPATDPLLQERYSRAELGGKLRQKRATCAELGLDPDAPLLVFIGRLVSEKGVDALVDGLPRILQRHPSACAALLGTGEPRYESSLLSLQALHAPRVAVAMAHDEGFAHRLYAAADVLLMPSWHEPCGLTQMYAMRYGAIPVVNPTGGLKDSVRDFDPATGAGTGAWMARADGEALAAAALRVLGWMGDGALWARLRDNVMATDHSWGASAARHVATYRRVSEER